MIVRGIKTEPSKVLKTFDWFNDYKDTRIWAVTNCPGCIPELDKRHTKWLSGLKKELSGSLGKLWVLTGEVNDHDQYGAYFISCWVEKPTIRQLKVVLPKSQKKELAHVLNGGGRRGVEDVWYHLFETQEGTAYQSLE